MFKKKINEEQLRTKIAVDIYKVGADILSESKSWSPEKLAIIRDCFDIAGKVASGYELVEFNAG